MPRFRRRLVETSVGINTDRPRKVSTPVETTQEIQSDLQHNMYNTAANKLRFKEFADAYGNVWALDIRGLNRAANAHFTIPNPVKDSYTWAQPEITKNYSIAQLFKDYPEFKTACINAIGDFVNSVLGQVLNNADAKFEYLDTNLMNIFALGVFNVISAKSPVMDKLDSDIKNKMVKEIQNKEAERKQWEKENRIFDDDDEANALPSARDFSDALIDDIELADIDDDDKDEISNNLKNRIK